MTILITGGLGYIGSITAAYLAGNEHKDVIILDNLHNSKITTLHKLQKQYPATKFIFYQGDIRNDIDLKNIFESHKIDIVIHMAALKAVKESFEQALKYYDVNVSGTIKLLDYMKTYGCKNIIFSSSATVYGNAPSPVSLSSLTGIGITNPYGQTKNIIETILRDVSKEFNVIILRYFNPIGAHINQKLGEKTNDTPNNLFPYILGAVSGKYPPLKIFGNDYNTPDGTCIRDYIDINDLAEAHVAAVNRVKNFEATNTKIEIYNIGTGVGVSVLDLIKTFEKVNNISIPYEFAPRRSGDLPEVYAHISASTCKSLNWKPKYTIADSCLNGWKFEKNDVLFN